MSLRTQLEAGRAEQSREPPRQLPPSCPGKGKEVAAPDDVDLLADDELSSSSSPLPRRSLSPNAVEAHWRKRPPRLPSRSIIVARRRVQREPSRDQRSPTPAHRYVLDQAGASPNQRHPCARLSGPPPCRRCLFPPPFGDHKTCSPLPFDSISWTTILPAAFLYPPPPPFAMYDGSSDPYDHTLHYNQAMILNAEDDRLLCKVFSASLKGPALAWFHKLSRGSINMFGELWVAFVS